MKTNQYLLHLVILLFFAVFTFACGGGETEEETTTTTNTESSNTEDNGSSSTEGTENLAQRVTVKNKEGLNIVSFEITSDESIIMFEKGSTLTGQRTKADKSKYIDNNGDVYAEVKHKESGFKVRTPEGELLWKVKFKDDKIKISDNEENQNPNEVKEREYGYKVYMSGRDKEIGKVKYKDGKVDIDGEGTDLKIPAEKNSYAFGVLMLTNIPKEYRYIIMAELLAKGM